MEPTWSLLPSIQLRPGPAIEDQRVRHPDRVWSWVSSRRPSRLRWAEGRSFVESLGHPSDRVASNRGNQDERIHDSFTMAGAASPASRPFRRSGGAGDGQTSIDTQTGTLVGQVHCVGLSRQRRVHERMGDPAQRSCGSGAIDILRSRARSEMMSASSYPAGPATPRGATPCDTSVPPPWPP